MNEGPVYCDSFNCFFPDDICDLILPFADFFGDLSRGFSLHQQQRYETNNVMHHVVKNRNG